MNDTKIYTTYLLTKENLTLMLKMKQHVSLNISYRRRNDWRALTQIPGVQLILSVATAISTTRSSTVSSSVSYIKISCTFLEKVQ